MLQNLEAEELDVVVAERTDLMSQQCGDSRRQSHMKSNSPVDGFSQSFSTNLPGIRRLLQLLKVHHGLNEQ